MKINGRARLIEMIKRKYPFLDKCATNIVDDVFNELRTAIDELESEDSVTILKFGRFKKTRRETRITKNPATGEIMEVPEHDIVRFKYVKKGGGNKE